MFAPLMQGGVALQGVVVMNVDIPPSSDARRKKYSLQVGDNLGSVTGSRNLAALEVIEMEASQSIREEHLPPGRPLEGCFELLEAEGCADFHCLGEMKQVSCQ